MDAVELKACPFCGSQNVELRDPHGAFSRLAVVACDDCEIRGPLATNAGQAIAAWNTRLINSTPTEEPTFGRAVSVLEQHYYTDAELAEWLSVPHPQLEGRTALEALANGQKAEVIAIVERLEGGVYL